MRDGPMFTRGNFIAPYRGVTMTKSEFDNLYDFYADDKKYESTGPYTIVKADGHIVDGICMRSVGAYANDYRRSEQITPNAMLREDGLYAKRNIYAGNEIVVDYGKHYWEFSKNLRVRHKIIMQPVTNVDKSMGQRGEIVQ
jgi:hypothetical protein